MRIPSGSTTYKMPFVAVDETDFTSRETGLSTWTVYRSRNGGTATAWTTPTITEADATNMAGDYWLTIDEDTTLGAGVDEETMLIEIAHAGMAPVSLTVQIYRPKITAGETLTVASGIGQAAVQSIVANAITATSIASSALTAAKFGASAITSTVLADSAITAAKLATGAISAAKFAANAITSTVVADSTITAAKIATDAITAAKIAPDAIGASELAADAVTEIQSGLATAAALATVDTVVDGIQTDLSNGTDGLGAIKADTAAILADTNELQTNQGNWLTATGFATAASVAALNDLSAAEVNAEVDTALADYDAPTKAELDAGFTEIKGATFSGATDSLEAIRDRGDAAWTSGGGAPSAADIRAEIDSNSTQLAAIVADTNELQTNQGNWLTATGFATSAAVAALNDLSAAEVNAEVDAALADYDAPTKAELDAAFTEIKGATFAGATDSLEALRDRGDAAWTSGGAAPSAADIRAEIDSNSTQLAAIVADTNELQTNQGNWLTATGFATPANVATELATYDGPTKAELDAGLAALNDFDPDTTAVDVGAINGSIPAAIQLALSAGTIVAGAAETGTLSVTQMTTDLTELTDEHYRGKTLIWTSGVLTNQAVGITDYLGSTGRLTYTAATEAPSDGDTFIIV